MKAVVTGGAGFIGSHLIGRLLADGHSVLALNNFSTGGPDNLSHLAGHPRMSLERARTPGAYGAVFVFLGQKLNGPPYRVVGDGTQSRDFNFVSDMVDAFLTVAQSPVAAEVFNVGTGAPVAANRPVELLKSDVVHVLKRPGEPDRTHADIGKIQRRLGWRPKVSIEEGIRILLENIDYWRPASVWPPESIEVATRDRFRYLRKE